MSSFPRFLPLLAVALAPLASATPARVDPRIGSLLDQLGKVRAVDAVQLSPDGQHLAWVVDSHGKPMIEIAGADGGGARPLAMRQPGSCRQEELAWSPDSHRLAFLSDCGGKDGQMDVYTVDVGANQAPRRLAALHGNAQSLRWSPDGHALGFLYVEGATRRASALAAAKPPAGEIGVEGLEVQRVATVPAAGGAPVAITPAGTYVYEFDWSPDARQLAFVGAPAPGDNNWWIAKLYAQDAEAGATPRVLVDPKTIAGPLRGLQIALPRWSPDGRRLAFIGGLMSDQGATGGDLYAVPATGGAAVDLTPGIRATPAWFAWTSPHTLLVSRVSNGQS